MPRIRRLHNWVPPEVLERAQQRQLPMSQIDIVDLVLIGEFAEIDAKRLRNALATIFEHRARQSLLDAIPLPPSSWARPYAVMAREVGFTIDIEAGHAVAARLLDPVLRAEAGGHWDRDAGCWR